MNRPSFRQRPVWRACAAAALIAINLLCQPFALANEDYIRLSKDANGRASALQVAVLSFENPERSVVVDLIGALHVGEQDYYAKLNDRFQTYDVLLYELIAPDGVTVEPGAERSGFLAGAQLAMTDGLGLAYQLDEIDYTAENFVHADLSPSQLLQAMEERGETPAVFAWRLFVASMRETAKDPLGVQSTLMLADLFGPSSLRTKKIAMARELMDMEQMQDLLGDDATSSIIGARNQRAAEVLQTELSAGRTRIGIFYGAGHMPDLERRLIEDLGLTRTATEWLNAWDLSVTPGE